MDRLIYGIYRRWQPEEGWLPLFLIFAIGSTVVTAVLAVDWVPEAGVVGWAVTLGLGLSIYLAKRPISQGWAAFLLGGYGVATTAIFLGRLIPPWPIFSSGLSNSLIYIRQSLFLFCDRIGGWTAAVFKGESSEETIVFAIGLGIISWVLIAFIGWTTYRQQNPLNGLIIVGTALALNAFYGNGGEWSLIVYISLAVLLTAVIHMTDMEQVWDRRRIDYPADVKIELILTAGGVALALMAFSFVLPAINIRTITRAFVEQTAVQQAEQSLERAFAGVNIDEGNLLGQSLERGEGGSALPRSFLLGNPPELAETLVMTVTVEGLASDDGFRWPLHWRAFSYDVYNGRGWAVSSEREEVIRAGERLPLLPIESLRILSQSVFWALGDTNTRYTMGLPLRFDHDVTVHWRGLSDLSQVRGEARDYSAESQVVDVQPDLLRQASLGDVPDTILARYTALPNNVPERVIELAQEVVVNQSGERGSAYDQTKAIEQFLRQYPYSLDLPLPPRNQDLVDYFLFDLQSGYCDYYATSMVIMARSLGIPSRFATGFLAQPPDENGVQQIYQLNAHSWAEVYFAGYGWVEFEPTAAFPNQTEADAPPDFQPSQAPEFGAADLLALPPAVESGSGTILTNGYFLVVLGLFVVVVVGLIWMMRRRPAEQDSVLAAYGRLQRGANWIGQPTSESQTPIEFKATFKNRIDQLIHQSRLADRLLEARSKPLRPVKGLPEEAAELTEIYMAHQYGRQDEAEREKRGYTAGLIWRRIRVRLWLLAVVNKFRRPD